MHPDSGNINPSLISPESQGSNGQPLMLGCHWQERFYKKWNVSRLAICGNFNICGRFSSQIRGSACFIIVAAQRTLIPSPLTVYSSSSDQAALCDVVSARKRYHCVPGLLYLSPIHFLAMSPQSFAKSMSVHSNTVPWQMWDNNGKGVYYGEC